MTDVRMSEALRLLDPPAGQRPWYGGASALGALRGVDHVQAMWRPYPGRHTIWELALHIAYWNYGVRRRLDESVPRGAFPRTPANWPRMPLIPNPGAWKRDRALLRSEHEALVEVVRSFDPRRLDEKRGESDYRYVDLILGVVTHDIYHTGQIQLMKRLYREAGQ
jgi:uncharacterized damage-inducible protein DinB